MCGIENKAEFRLIVKINHKNHIFYNIFKDRIKKMWYDINIVSDIGYISKNNVKGRGI